VGIASLILSNRVVTDPPHLKLAHANASRSVDWWGLGLIAAGLGCLEYVLDKGQEDDWFHSSAIVGFSIVSAVSLVSFVFWELQHENPIVDLKMFRRRSFAVANGLMLVLGVALFGSTVLLPQYLQVLMGYTAQQAGMALSPGGFVVILLLPFVGRLVNKIDVRWLITIGFLSLSSSLIYMAHKVNLEMDFREAVWLRTIQMAGLAFLFVPIQTVSYAGVEPQKFNQVSGIMNLSRNMGGDIGIAFVTTLITRRAQAHQMTLSAHTTPYNPAYAAKIDAMTRVFENAGAATVDAARQATAAMYRQLVQQATQLAYLDALLALGVATALMVPLVWLAKRAAPMGAPMGH
jgi:DHA2 family multidrug resistance protein